MAAKPRSLRERFKTKFIIHPRTRCWMWTADLNKGYGKLWDNETKHNRLATHISYELHIGPVPDGMQVCHTCDTPACVNPEHLYLGTPLDNMRDKIAKGRAVYLFGANHHQTRITDEQVRSIRTDPRSHGQIAAEYSVSKSHISLIKSGKNRSSVL